MLVDSKKKITIKVTEVLSRNIEISAKSEESAFDKVRTMYKDEDIVLDWGDLAGIDFKILNL